MGKIGCKNSSKYKKLEEILFDNGPLAKGEKFVIFSSMFKRGVTQKEHDELKGRYAELGLEKEYSKLEFNKSLDVILSEAYKKRTGKKLSLEVIDGSVKIDEREQIVERLSDGLDGVLCTTDTGGESLNFTAANWAVFLDQDYTPRTEEQAKARILRKGQNKDVHILHLRTQDTLEQKLRDYVLRKKIINEIAVDGIALTDDEWNLLNDTEGKRLIELLKPNIGGKSINVYEASPENLNDFQIIMRKQGKSKELSFSQERDGNETEAQELLRRIGKDPVNCWSNPEFVDFYMRVLPNLSTPVLHTARVIDILKRAKEGAINFPEGVLADASGPSMLYKTYNDLSPIIQSLGYKIPLVVDRDLSYLMLSHGGNPNRIIGDMTGKDSAFKEESFDFIDNGSLELLGNREEVKKTLLEANRILKPEGNIELILKNAKFIPEFYSGIENLGFEIISKKDEGFTLSKEFRKRLQQEKGEHFAEAYSQKLANTYLLLAKKIDKPQENVDAKNFWFERLIPLPNGETVRDNKELTSIDAERVSREIEKNSKSGNRPKKQKVLRRMLPEQIPGLKIKSKDIKGEF